METNFVAVRSKEELNFRIALNDMILKWLHSDDPMLKDPKWKPLIPEAIRFHEATRTALRLERGDTIVGLKTATLSAIVPK